MTVKSSSTSIVSVSLPSWEDDDTPDDFEIPQRCDISPRKGDLTPMVDVTILVMIFYLSSAASHVFRTQRFVEVFRHVPVWCVSTPIYSPSVFVDVVIDDTNRIFVDTEEVAGFDAVRESLRDARGNHDEAEVTITVDPQSTHGHRILVADAAVDAGFIEINSWITHNY